MLLACTHHPLTRLSFPPICFCVHALMTCVVPPGGTLFRTGQSVRSHFSASVQPWGWVPCSCWQCVAAKKVQSQLKCSAKNHESRHLELTSRCLFCALITHHNYDAKLKNTIQFLVAITYFNHAVKNRVHTWQVFHLLFMGKFLWEHLAEDAVLLSAILSNIQVACLVYCIPDKHRKGGQEWINGTHCSNGFLNRITMKKHIEVGRALAVLEGSCLKKGSLCAPVATAEKILLGIQSLHNDCYVGSPEHQNVCHPALIVRSVLLRWAGW